MIGLSCLNPHTSHWLDSRRATMSLLIIGTVSKTTHHVAQLIVMQSKQKSKSPLNRLEPKKKKKMHIGRCWAADSGAADCWGLWQRWFAIFWNSTKMNVCRLWVQVALYCSQQEPSFRDNLLSSSHTLKPWTTLMGLETGVIVSLSFLDCSQGSTLIVTEIANSIYLWKKNIFLIWVFVKN